MIAHRAQVAFLLLTILATEDKAAVWQKRSIRRNSSQLRESQRSTGITPIICHGLQVRGKFKLGVLETRGQLHASCSISTLSLGEILRTQVALEAARKRTSSEHSLAIVIYITYAHYRDERVLIHSLTAKSTRNSKAEARDLRTSLQKRCCRSSREGVGSRADLAFFSALLCRRAGIAWRGTHE